MRSIPLSLLVTVMLTCASVQAEEQPSEPSAPAAPLDTQALEQRLAQSEQLRNEQEASSAVQLQRLRQENQRLRMQLKESQAQAQPRLLSEEQTWFAVGAALSLISMVFGALLRGSRKTRREWIN
ncbi:MULTISPECIES: translation initiation factor 2 (IF-2, GTPase) [Pseudomonas]|uniref:translation initiation factor 2 (IF-2, GTPase) n=1 Tax=Pseudomonas TaxID=286 RepID=UPI000F7A3AAA|nr:MULTISPECIES: translation initiation factor 2 (IF-2, GTPase) [Pseudomonas]MCW1937488.1 translation initiation factor 2 (IF-2, GTPase) [Pseudomonas sp. MDMC_285]RRV37533.1 translation initiation factor 2 (IF-2, GTPase) [Pseudomonas sp. o96-267]TRO15827.1 translation initiation factor 2 (IF-2, GTPase) [Pseudomonas mendocina]TRO23010.1 translation initiation factor 2 (IF-2, GTPase) [Pseudomonas mendocina]